MIRSAAMVSALALLLASLAACSTAPTSDQDRMALQRKADSSLRQAQMSDPTLKPMMDSAAAYAVFPAVGTGAAGVGGAYGKGVLYQGGRPVGWCDLSQADIGVQLGGQAYTEIICFETPDAVNRFKAGKFSFSAQASAVAIQSGAGANAKYADGVAAFTSNESGLMFKAAIGGQKFEYVPM
jgi:lipid-binding SYLF domain-containing protein